jgi:3-hydroxybutyryl-CoA dehydrogenase
VHPLDAGLHRQPGGPLVLRRGDALLGEGAADVATIDAVMREAGGFKMGPFELTDMIGHDVNFAVSRSVWNAYFNDPRFLPSLIQQELVDAGFYGRKSGRGFYDYREGAERPQPKSAVAQSVPETIVLHGHSPAVEAIADRLHERGVAYTWATTTTGGSPRSATRWSSRPMAAAPPSAPPKPASPTWC